LVVFVTVAIASVAPNTAAAQDVRGPDDGATVTSEPVFSFDPAATYASVELSRSVDVRADTGTFVDAAYSDAFIFDREPRDGVARWRQGRVAAGTYFWHASIEDADYRQRPWSPLRRFVVPDEPPRFEGMTINAKRLRPIGNCARVQLRGRVAWSDNDTDPMGTLRVGLGATTVHLPLDSADEYDDVVCARGAVSTAAFAIVDRAGNIVRAPDRAVMIVAGLRTISPRAGRACAPVILFSQGRGIRQTGTTCSRARSFVSAWMTSGRRGECDERACAFRGYMCASRDMVGGAELDYEVECRRRSGRVRFVDVLPDSR
jgi:hypothetical protein